MRAVWSVQKTYASVPKKPSLPVLKFSMTNLIGRLTWKLVN
jgi:hypothetical protein